MEWAPATQKYLDRLWLAANLAKKWGQASVSTEGTLAETLSVGGISLWEASAVDFARLYLPTLLDRDFQFRGLLHQFRSRGSTAKHNLLVHREIRRWVRNSVPLTTAQPLFLGSTEYIYRDVLWPVVLEYGRGQDATTIYDSVVWRPAAPAFEGIFESTWQHWLPAVKKRAADFRASVRSLQRGLMGSSEFRKVFFQDGENVWPWMERILTRMFEVHWPRLARHIAISEHVMASSKPSVVVSGDVADPWTRVFCFQARRVGIPSVQVQFGLCGPDSTEWQFCAADRLLVWGEQSANMMELHGVSRRRMSITGSARHDSSCVQSVSSQQVGLPHGKVAVLFASVYYLASYDPNSTAAVIEQIKTSIIEAAISTPEIFLMIKPHPREDGDALLRLVGNRKNITVLDPATDIREFIGLAQVFITFGSTSTVDALIANKLTVCPLFGEWCWTDLQMYANSGATVVVRTAAEIRVLFSRIGAGHVPQMIKALAAARQEFLIKWTNHADGQSARRVKDAIDGMAHRRLPE